MAMETARRQATGGFYIFLDMKKAYDRVSHDWLERVPIGVGFGTWIRSWITRI